MNVQSQIHAMSPESTEHFDVLIVGAGISGIGGAYHLTQQCPGTSFVVLETQESFGGTWLDPQISRHPLRQRPPHLRLPLQAMDQRADRDRRGNPQLYGRGDRRERPRAAYSLPAPDRRGELVERGQIAGPSRPTRPTPARRCASPRISCGCARAITGIREGYTPEWDGHGRLQGPHRPPADLAGRSRLRGQEGRRDRLGRDRGDADPGDRRTIARM